MKLPPHTVTPHDWQPDQGFPGFVVSVFVVPGFVGPGFDREPWGRTVQRAKRLGCETSRGRTDEWAKHP